jgi:hypothetical protein
VDYNKVFYGVHWYQYCLVLLLLFQDGLYCFDVPIRPFIPLFISLGYVYFLLCKVCIVVVVVLHIFSKTGINTFKTHCIFLFKYCSFCNNHNVFLVFIAESCIFGVHCLYYIKAGAGLE